MFCAFNITKQLLYLENKLCQYKYGNLILNTSYYIVVTCKQRSAFQGALIR